MMSIFRLTCTRHIDSLENFLRLQIYYRVILTEAFDFRILFLTTLDLDGLLGLTRILYETLSSAKSVMYESGGAEIYITY